MGLLASVGPGVVAEEAAAAGVAAWFQLVLGVSATVATDATNVAAGGSAAPGAGLGGAAS